MVEGYAELAVYTAGLDAGVPPHAALQYAMLLPPSPAFWHVTVWLGVAVFQRVRDSSLAGRAGEAPKSSTVGHGRSDAPLPVVFRTASKWGCDPLI